MKITTILFLSIILIGCSSNKKKVRSPEDKKADLYFTQGTKELVRGEYPNALKNLRLASLSRPNDTEIQNNLGMAYYYRKSHLNAIKHLKLAIKLDPTNEDARLNLGSLYMERGEFKKAQTLFEKILKSLVYNQQYKTHYNLGMLFKKKNNTSMAAKHFKMSTEVNQGYCPSYLRLARIHKQQGQLKAALRNFDEGSKGVCYSFFPTTRGHIILLAKLGQTDKAELKLADAQEHFTTMEQQRELKKIQKYIQVKIKRKL